MIGTQQPCQKKHVYVNADEFPVCCPAPKERLWDAHPRVYLTPLPSETKVSCPYCGTVYESVK